MQINSNLLVFGVVVVVALAVDIFAHRKNEKIGLKSAALWSVFWTAVAVGFGLYLWVANGSEMASLFFAGYTLEKALSVDNLFVMMAIFSWFNIPEIYRHRVLYYGILGAIIFRLIFVVIGANILKFGVWVEMIFAIIIAYTAIMMMRKNDDNDIKDYSNHLAYRLVYRFFPVFTRLIGGHFFTSKTELASMGEDTSKFKRGYLIATPLFLCLAVVEISDVMFAFDSVPAVIAVSREPLIVYSAMIFAILGLRTLYFVLETLKDMLIYLEKAVIILLFFIAFKLLLNSTNHIFSHGFEISSNLSLVVILGILGFGVLASLVKKNI